MRMSRVAFLVVSSAIVGATAGWAKPVGVVGAVVAQLPRYSASGTHTCDSGRSCMSVERLATATTRKVRCRSEIAVR
jgi:hypothetical protein